jgi:integrase
MEPRLLDAHEVTLLFEAAHRTRDSSRDLALFCLAADAGLRRSELVAARSSDFDPTRRVLIVGSSARRRVIRLGYIATAAVTGVQGRSPGEALFVDRHGRPVTERVVHEQLRRIGELAGLGEWVTCRHLRRTYISSIATDLPTAIALRLAGHTGARVRPASVDEAVAAQSAHGWRSPLDTLLGTDAFDVALAA